MIGKLHYAAERCMKKNCVHIIKVDVTDTTVVPAYYGHDRRVYSTDPLQTRPSCTRRSCMLWTRPPQDGDTHQPNYYH